MQQELNEPSKRNLNSINEDSQSARNHGNPHLQSADLHGHHGDPLLVQDVTSGTPPSVARGSESSSDDATLPGQLEQLSLSSRGKKRPKPSFHQISEYESALSPSSVRRHEGPGFTVVKTRDNTNDENRLDLFPNEVLTHVLSHLSPNDLFSFSRVCKRLYKLVHTPHSWLSAFSRYFPGQDAIQSGSTVARRRGSDQEEEQLRSAQRFFTPLTALATWRSEYIDRTRLLRSLARGKPAAQIAHGPGASSHSNSAANNVNAVVTYSSQIFSIINHIDANFGTGKKSPRFIHGSDESGFCTASNDIAKIDNWGLTDPHSIPQFADLFVGDMPYGLGEGPAGCPNVMAVSQLYGMIYGAGYPGGNAYFRAPDELRGRTLVSDSDISEPEFGIPRIPSDTEAITAVWIAKSSSIPIMTGGLMAILTGSSLGVLTAYSLSSDTARRRVGRGQVQAKWVLSPGVPIIQISLDDAYNTQRKARGRIWAVALNALGEVYYLKDTITSTLDGKPGDNDVNKHAWSTGRTVHWSLVESSRRIARDDPYQEAEFHGSFSPRSSCNAMKLSKEQLVAETREIEQWLGYKPSHFRDVCEGWDMQRKLEVDFAGDDENGAGEGIVVVKCGIDEQPAEIRRYTWSISKSGDDSKFHSGSKSESGCGESSVKDSTLSETLSTSLTTSTSSLWGGKADDFTDTSTPLNHDPSVRLVEDWRVTNLSLKGFPEIEITATAIDLSIHALTTVNEDPLSIFSGASNASSPTDTPLGQSPTSGEQIPGHRARLIALGTKKGEVILFNMRGPSSMNPTMVNELQPLRIISTDSPSIMCLAVSCLFVIHGGPDGLVQAWDILASTLEPIRTLNSRFSSRARRRLIQAEMSVHGVGINMYSAGAIVLDPDPTVLRGMVSLGTHLRYWSYSSSATDQYSGKKRRLRRSGPRGSNAGQGGLMNSGRLKDYIATEQEDLRQEKERKAKHEARLRHRFGLGNLNEEEALQYAALASVESFQKDEERRVSDAGYLADASPASSYSVWSSSDATVTSEPRNPMTPPKFRTNMFEDDLEEAIRLSLLEGTGEYIKSPRALGSGNYEIPITYKQKKSRRSPSSSPPMAQSSKFDTKTKATGSGAKDATIANDLDFALQLSIAEERSRVESGKEDFHSSGDEVGGKGKRPAN